MSGVSVIQVSGLPLIPLSLYRHDGLIIMATNRPYDLDEAMHRRIMIAMEFHQPDHILRKSIWENHIPEQMKLAEDVNMVRKINNQPPLLLIMCREIIDMQTHF